MHTGRLIIMPASHSLPLLLLLLGLVSFSLAIPFDPETNVWPISGTSLPDLPQSSTFGPRLLASAGLRYDFHRGVDIPTDPQTPCYAVADGTVRINGAHSSFSDTVVQITHEMEDGTEVYATYLHLTAAADGLEIDDEVKKGDIIAYSGASSGGFAHLHFELRYGCSSKGCNVNPWGLLPYTDTADHTVTFKRAKKGNDGLEFKCRVKTSSDELDFNRIVVKGYNREERLEGGGYKSVVSGYSHLFKKTFDFNEINLEFKDDTSDLDEADIVNGILVDPKRFNHNAYSDHYEIDYTFTINTAKVNALKKKNIWLVAKATDVHHNTVTAEVAVPDPLQNLSAPADHITPTSLKVTWDKRSEFPPPKCYQLQMKVEGESEWSDIKKCMNNRRKVVSGLTPDTEHKFRVRAVTHLGKSKWSDVLSVSTLA